MKFLKKAFMMFSRKQNTLELHKSDPITVEVSVAIQRNERASIEARKALQELKMSDTLASIARRM